ncbi:hypothetical protein BV22DRAFT_1199252 [Leucogyrophana mollusca]|uniref:Uncharacterized protein n=1 Tax=Leucogyrophana mollusca TaxID=85980 RepID=A0ACB8B2M0_9AGAM|nr:hypothetical protein BV22DRAFT_1199252 [Leucogyrophana mollusca]
MHSDLTQMMRAAGLHAVSIAADGTETERGAQRIIVASAHSIYIYGIPNKVPKCTLELNIPLFHGRPTVAVQDSKHGAKTARNQLFTGARLLALGNFPMHYKMIRDIADHASGPLFHRDVEGVDKQDDRAAARFLSAETLDFNMKHFSEHTALSTYLFVLGELIDAWQNRNISHVVRAKMVMRARFFLMAWQSHVAQNPDHNAQINLISRESYDIFVTLCDSLLQLVLVYRRYYPTYPLLPWMHSTEPCEHIFGLLRHLKKDFNFADMLLLERKLQALMVGAFQHLTPEEQANQTAAGYHHTYFNAPDLDTAALMTWPTDSELEKASNEAFKEVTQLLAAVGIDAQSMLESYTPPKPPNTKGMPKTQPRRPQTLFDLLQLYAAAPLTPNVEEEVETCEMALAADDADKTFAIMSLPDSMPSDEQIAIAEVEKHRQAAEDAMSQQMSSSTGTAQVMAPPSTGTAQVTAPPSSEIQFVNPTTLALERDSLVAIRRHHQPQSTAKAVRQVNRLLEVATQVPPPGSVNSTEPEMSVREALTKRLAALVPDVQHTTSGANRKIRHTGVYALNNGKTSTREMQRSTLQDTAATKFARYREPAFAHLQDVHANMHNANITDFTPLAPGHFVAVLKPGKQKDQPEILLGEVLTMYTNSGGRGSQHCWIPCVNRVGIPSYVNIRVFRLSFGCTYSSMSCPPLGASSFMRIPQTHIIFSFATASRDIIIRSIETDNAHPFTLVTLCPFSTGIMQALCHRIHAVHAAVQLLIKARRGGGPVVADALPNGADDAEESGAEGVDGEEDTFSGDEDI